jgi:hypothetical protein
VSFDGDEILPLSEHSVGFFLLGLSSQSFLFDLNPKKTMKTSIQALESNVDDYFFPSFGSAFFLATLGSLIATFFLLALGFVGLFRGASVRGLLVLLLNLVVRSFLIVGKLCTTLQREANVVRDGCSCSFNKTISVTVDMLEIMIMTHEWYHLLVPHPAHLHHLDRFLNRTLTRTRPGRDVRLVPVVLAAVALVELAPAGVPLQPDVRWWPRRRSWRRVCAVNTSTHR